MNEKLVKIDLPPGIKKAGTVYEAHNRWYDGNLVRFFQGDKMPVGGWRRVQDSAGANLAALTGTPRAVLSIRLNDGSPVTVVSTTSKLYTIAGGTTNDDTPAAYTTGDVNGAYAASGGSFGYGPFGAGPFGVGATGTTFADPTTYQLDPFGQSVVAVDTKNKKLYVWAGTPGTDAAEAANAPATVNAVVVTPERFIFALGTISTAGGSVNARLVRWPSQETSTTWTPAANNSAGEFEIASSGKLMAGRRGKLQTFLWTDADMWSATFVSSTAGYGFRQLGNGCGLIAPNAHAPLDGGAIWMGQKGFFAYDGHVRPLACEVSDYVFNDLNELQRAKVWAMPIHEYGEVWWFYPSGAATEIDRYVCYSYRENHWSIGRLVRLAGCPSGATTLPIMAGSTGLLWEHEVGQARDSLVPHLESGPFELGEGDQVTKVLRLIPDEKTLGDVTATFYHQMYPLGTETTSGPHTLTQPTDLRFTARQARIRLSESRQTGWRVGTPRLGVLPGSRR